MKTSRECGHCCSVLIISAVLTGCSKAPPFNASNTTAPLSPTARAAPAQAEPPAHPGESADTLQSVSGSEVTHSNAGVRADAQSASLEKGALMAALLPDWKPDEDTSTSTAPLSPSAEVQANQDSSEDPHVSGADHIHVELATGDTDLYPQPWGVVKFDAFHAVLITEANGGTGTAGGSYVIVGTYFFTNRQGTWHLSKAQDVVTNEYSNELTELKTEQWPGHGVLLSLMTESGNHGDFARRVNMTLLRPDSATHLLTASLSERDEGDTFTDKMGVLKDGVGCDALESDDFKLPPGDTMFTEIDCHSAEGHWSLDGDQIHFNYEGVKRKGNEDGSVPPLQRWKSTVTYRWEHEHMELVEGKNPEFGY